MFWGTLMSKTVFGIAQDDDIIELAIQIVLLGYTLI